MNPYSDEDEDIEFDEIGELDDDESESEPFWEDEAAMEQFEIDVYPVDSLGRDLGVQ